MLRFGQSFAPKKYVLKRNDKLNAYIRSGTNEIAQFLKEKLQIEMLPNMIKLE